MKRKVLTKPNVSHDLRSLLTPIIGYAELLSRKLKEKENVAQEEHYAQKIYEQAMKIKKYLENI